MALPVLTPEQRHASPREGRRGAEEARGAEGRAEVREANAEGRAGQVGRRHRRQDEGVQRARVAPGRRQGARPEAHGGARHLRQPPRPRPRAPSSARCSSRSSRSNRLASRRGRLIVIAGPSGVGKGSVVRRLLDRDRRRGMLAGVLDLGQDPGAPGRTSGTAASTHFISERQFDAMLRDDELLEWAPFVDHRSGTPRRFVEDSLAAGRDVILEIDVKGAEQVRTKVPDAILIFLAPPVHGGAGTAPAGPRDRGRRADRQTAGRRRRGR